VSTQVTFYAVRDGGLHAWAAKLVEAAWSKRKRVLVYCSSEAEAKAIDEYLWTFKDDAFIPHGIESPDQPSDNTALAVLITTTATNTNKASILVQLGHAELEFGGGFENVIELVDREDEQKLTASRDRYRAWKAYGKDHDVTVDYKA
jgi:DNA polymerase-3 subunit chi